MVLFVKSRPAPVLIIKMSNGSQWGERIVVQLLRSVSGSRYRHVVFSGGGAGMRLSSYARFGAAMVTGRRERERGPTDAAVGAAGDDEDLFAFCHSLFRQVGVDAAAYRLEVLRRRVPACLRALRAGCLREARLRLEKQPELSCVAAGAMIIGVTSFFRDPEVFDHLAQHAIPLLARRRKGPLRVWSGACCTGEELYSVAMLLAEQDLLHDSLLLGTDCRTRALKQARRGVYDGRALKHVPHCFRDRYFELDDEQPEQRPDRAGFLRYRVTAPLREAAQWRSGDLTQLCEPGGWDLILCRNTAIYFRPEVSRKVFESFETALRPGGFLILGRAERPAGTRRLSAVAPCIYRRDRG